MSAVHQNCGTDSRAFCSFSALSFISYSCAAGSSRRTMTLLRSHRIAPSLRCHILSPSAPIAFGNFAQALVRRVRVVIRDLFPRCTGCGIRSHDRLQFVILYHCIDTGLDYFRVLHSNGKTVWCEKRDANSPAFICIGVMNCALQQGKILVETGRIVWRTMPISELIIGFAKTMPCRRS